jgi:L-2,4-diaminobutyric acid acetyltransferase
MHMERWSIEQARGTPGRAASTLKFRKPRANDGFEIRDLVADCPPLDLNSLYCYVLQCTDYAETCILAENAERIVGWVSGYRQPTDPSVLFIWQVAVHAEARGQGVAKRSILCLLERPACDGVDLIKTTITLNNAASFALFESVAADLNAPISQRPWFDQETHFRGHHDSEHLVTIGPCRKPSNLLAVSTA